MHKYLLTFILGVSVLGSTYSCVAQKNASEKEAATSAKLVFPDNVVSKHSITLNGKKIDYTATVGHLTLHDEKGKEKAHFFYTAYVQDNADKKKRPITFTFNGGPGSSSVWLHMGALGPKRVLMNDDGTAVAPPFGIVDNEYSWLDKTDLVFIDPIETGLSRPAEGVDKKDFTGYKEDVESVGDFIYRYTTDNKRWSSPKYLCGESYGTTRAVGLSGYLQDRHGMYLNGLVLVSAVLNFQTLYFASGNDLPHALFLPSFAASAYHHNKIDKQKFPNFPDFLKKAEAFALNDYNTALMKGDKLSEQEKEQLAKKLSDFTGLSVDFIKSYHCRINTSLFAKELLRNEGYTVGRFDALVKGKDRQSGGTSYEFDPSYNLSIFGTYTAALHQHLSGNLNYIHPTQTYEILTGKVRPWNYGNEGTNKYLDNSDVLRSSIHKNPNLKVLICNGYYDLATPYFATEYTLNHLFLADEFKNNITMQYYHGGHMMYTMKQELEKFTKDVRAFYE
jgi:carboxypeptidase C (cathepsin A)